MVRQLRKTETIENITNYDIMLFKNSSIGFTGTPWITLPGEIVGLEVTDKYSKHFENINGQNYKMFNILYNSEYIDANKTNINEIYEKKYNGIIDIGYWYNNSTIIDDQKLLNKIEATYKYIYIFVNDIENLFDIKNKKYILYANRNENVTKQEIFYFIDNGHITGVNIPVPTLSNFLITTINKSLLRDIHQGIYRLRLLGYCHHVTIMIDNKNKCDVIKNW